MIKKLFQLKMTPWVLGASLLLLPMVWPDLSFSKEATAAKSTSAIAWQQDFDAALKQAKQENKRVLLRFTAAWCGPCRVMENQSWPSEEVVHAVNQDWIPVYLDVDQASAQAAAQRYGIAAIPTIVAVDANGQVLARSGFMSASKLSKFLSKVPQS